MIVWRDREIPTGKAFDQVIEEAIAEARCVVVLWAATSDVHEGRLLVERGAHLVDLNSSARHLEPRAEEEVRPDRPLSR